VLLALGALVVASVGRPEACASVWTWEHDVHRCCQLASQTRWTKAGGDCCDIGILEDRDPGATAGAVDVPPSVFVRTSAPTVAVAPPATRWLDADALVPERPPDRAHATTVLLI
jgi:hypothetical protein